MANGRMSVVRAAIVSGLSLAVLAGCGGGTDKYKAKRPKTVSVTGKLTFKGAPVADATVVFAPTEPSGVAASSQTDSSGTLLPKAFPPDPGMVPGVYKVVATKFEQAAAPATPSGGHDDPMLLAKPKNLLPKKYADASTSDVSITITDKGTDSLAIELKE